MVLCKDEQVEEMLKLFGKKDSKKETKNKAKIFGRTPKSNLKQPEEPKTADKTEKEESKQAIEKNKEFKKLEYDLKKAAKQNDENIDKAEKEKEKDESEK